MTREQIRELRQRAYRTFYSRPRYLLRRVMGLRHPSEIRTALKSAKALFWLWAKKDVFGRSSPGRKDAGLDARRSGEELRPPLSV
jgi:hypothetical protein